MTTLPLFETPTLEAQTLSPGAVLLRGWARAAAAEWVAQVTAITAQAPFRVMLRPGGAPLSVAMTNCGAYGWVSDARRYSYSATDPDTGLPWPAMPAWLLAQAQAAADAAGHPSFAPDACLINRYLPGAKLTLHSDNDEADLTGPIVSVSLGLSATFLWGGLQRRDPVQRVLLQHGDVLVWGGPARMTYHGVSPLRDGQHALLGRERWNLTFRMARARYGGAAP